MNTTRRLHGHDVTAHHHGAPDAPLVVLLHGMMEPADVWHSVVHHLVQADYRCVVLDMPWNGRQGGLWGQDVRSESWLNDTLDAFDLRPDAWIAHSFGASTLLAWLSSSDRPGAHAPAVLISPFYKARHQDITWPLFEQYVTRFTDFVAMSIRLRLGPRQIDPGVLHSMTEKARDAFGCYVWVHFWQLFSRMPFLRLERLRQPILTLTGTEDISSPLADAQALTTALPDGAIQAFPACGHFLLSHCESEAINAIDRFLAQVCPARLPTRHCA